MRPVSRLQVSSSFRAIPFEATHSEATLKTHKGIHGDCYLNNRNLGSSVTKQ